MYRLRKEKEKINYREVSFGLVVFLLAFMGDQVSKLFLERSGVSFTVNTGIAFGLFQSQLAIFWMEFFTLFILAAWGVWNYEKGDGGKERIGTALIVGGGLSNLFDRVIRGGVMDYLNLGVGPHFNLADCFICTGVIILLAPVFLTTLLRRED